jgi:phosphatidylglycerol---prolipoprotein diacylglyceryl transferase
LESVVGLAGAKLDCAPGHYVPEERRARQLVGGSSIQGFILATVAAPPFVGARGAHLPFGSLLDATAPALMFAMAIGRDEYFFGGCRAGRPTLSRWGLWSSDRRVGVRRVPVQLLESNLALTIGFAGLLALWTTKLAPAGALFVGTDAAYTLDRHLLFPLRDRPRHTAHGRILVLAFCAAVIMLDVAVGLLAS